MVLNLGNGVQQRNGASGAKHSASEAAAVMEHCIKKDLVCWKLTVDRKECYDDVKQDLSDPGGIYQPDFMSDAALAPVREPFDKWGVDGQGSGRSDILHKFHII